FNDLVKFANYGGVLPTPEFLSAKFQRGLNEKIAKRMSNTVVRNFADLVTQCKRVESVYNRYPKSGSLRTSAPPGNNNRGGYHQNNNRGGGLQVRQPPGQFKKGGGQRSGNNDRNSAPRCDKCNRFHQGPCTVNQLRRYIPDESHVVIPDDIEIRENLKVPIGPSERRTCIGEKNLQWFKVSAFGAASERTCIGKEKKKEKKLKVDRNVSSVEDIHDEPRNQVDCGDKRMKLEVEISNRTEFVYKEQEDDDLTMTWPQLFSLQMREVDRNVSSVEDIHHEPRNQVDCGDKRMKEVEISNITEFVHEEQEDDDLTMTWQELFSLQMREANRVLVQEVDRNASSVEDIHHEPRNQVDCGDKRMKEVEISNRNEFVHEEQEDEDLTMTWSELFSLQMREANRVDRNASSVEDIHHEPRNQVDCGDKRMKEVEISNRTEFVHEEQEDDDLTMTWSELFSLQMREANGVLVKELDRNASSVEDIHHEPRNQVDCGVKRMKEVEISNRTEFVHEEQEDDDLTMTWNASSVEHIHHEPRNQVDCGDKRMKEVEISNITEFVDRNASSVEDIHHEPRNQVDCGDKRMKEVEISNRTEFVHEEQEDDDLTMTWSELFSLQMREANVDRNASSVEDIHHEPRNQVDCGDKRMKEVEIFNRTEFVDRNASSVEDIHHEPRNQVDCGDKRMKEVEISNRTEFVDRNASSVKHIHHEPRNQVDCGDKRMKEVEISNRTEFVHEEQEDDDLTMTWSELFSLQLREANVDRNASSVEDIHHEPRNQVDCGDKRMKEVEISNRTEFVDRNASSVEDIHHEPRNQVDCGDKRMKEVEISNRTEFVDRNASSVKHIHHEPRNQVDCGDKRMKEVEISNRTEFVHEEQEDDDLTMTWSELFSLQMREANRVLVQEVDRNASSVEDIHHEPRNQVDCGDKWMKEVEISNRTEFVLEEQEDDDLTMTWSELFSLQMREANRVLVQEVDRNASSVEDIHHEPRNQVDCGDKRMKEVEISNRTEFVDRNASSVEDIHHEPRNQVDCGDKRMKEVEISNRTEFVDRNASSVKHIHHEPRNQVDCGDKRMKEVEISNRTEFVHEEQEDEDLTMTWSELFSLQMREANRVLVQEVDRNASSVEDIHHEPRNQVDCRDKRMKEVEISNRTEFVHEEQEDDDLTMTWSELFSLQMREANRVLVQEDDRNASSVEDIHHEPRNQVDCGDKRMKEVEISNRTEFVHEEQEDDDLTMTWNASSVEDIHHEPRNQVDCGDKWMKEVEISNITEFVLEEQEDDDLTMTWSELFSLQMREANRVLVQEVDRNASSVKDIHHEPRNQVDCGDKRMKEVEISNRTEFVDSNSSSVEDIHHEPRNQVDCRDKRMKEVEISNRTEFVDRNASSVKHIHHEPRNQVDCGDKRMKEVEISNRTEFVHEEQEDEDLTMTWSELFSLQMREANRVLVQEVDRNASSVEDIHHEPRNQVDCRDKRMKEVEISNRTEFVHEEQEDDDLTMTWSELFSLQMREANRVLVQEDDRNASSVEDIHHEPRNQVDCGDKRMKEVEISNRTEFVHEEQEDDDLTMTWSELFSLQMREANRVLVQEVDRNASSVEDIHHEPRNQVDCGDKRMKEVEISNRTEFVHEEQEDDDLTMTWSELFSLQMREANGVLVQEVDRNASSVEDIHHEPRNQVDCGDKRMKEVEISNRTDS
ncbi:uncharacterized protein LOC133302238, partial [Gastrolobium bilobum]|uniref:uncharacterized protein LOC133302238 n=1 Tax=Gastrolobium bilobum TaxID=150636 RepID=UPI002AB210A7